MDDTETVLATAPKDSTVVEHGSRAPNSLSLSSLRTAISKRRKLLWIVLGAILLVLAILALVLGLVFGLASQEKSRSEVEDITLSVDLGYSTYTGTDAANGVSQWLGVRYAQAPVGNLRFRAPQGPVVDGQTYNANKVRDSLHYEITY